MEQAPDYFENSNNDQPKSEQSASREAGQSTVIPVMAEQLVVGKDVVETGKIRISKSVTEHQESFNMPLNQEEVTVERVTLNQYLDTPPPPVRYEGDTMIIPVLKEVAVVQKRLLLVEELRVTKRQVQKQETQQVSLRQEEVQVTRVKDESQNI